MSFLAGLKNHFDFSQTKSQSVLVHSLRLGFLLLVLFITLTFQFVENRVEATSVFVPLYYLIGLSLLFQCAYLLFYDRVFSNRLLTSFLFFFEAFYITGLIYFIGIQQSVLVFLYLVNLILYGILFQRRGALFLALWTSILFSILISLDSSLSGNTAYLAIGVNNLAFFTVAYLAGFLSEQLNVMGAQLKEKVRDVATLRNLNDLILRNMGSGLATADNSERILQLNPKAEQLLGLQVGAGTGQLISDLLPGVDFLQAKSGRPFDAEFKRDGERRIFNISVSPLKDDTGHLQGQIISFSDETHMRSLEKRLRQSEKMAAIGQLATGIAHEIRNPLAGISGSIQLLQADDADVEQNGKLMKIVEREISRLNNLITEFLDFAKPEAPMEDHIRLGSLVEEIIGFVQLDQNMQEIPCRFEEVESIVVLGNRDKLKQAFLNIIVNAFQALESVDSPQLEISVYRSGDYGTVSVKDNGIGMTDTLKQRIFEPFHTTKHKGTGLGLAITHSIFESHGAQIQVESEVGVGTEFRMSFKILRNGI